ncbi:hypothetical protein KKG08_01485 [Patescibacteria group bacterium]|nr:hypothetical protein [Patescibacteria group bacterium]
MPKDFKKALIALVLVFGISATSYFIFTKYSPKILRKLEEVKGIKTISSDNLPYPTDSKKIGFFETPQSRQVTLQTRKTLEEISQFYRNIYENKNYKLISERDSPSFLELKFKKNDEVVTIVGSLEEDADYTTFSINITTL